MQIRLCVFKDVSAGCASLIQKCYLDLLAKGHILLLFIFTESRSPEVDGTGIYFSKGFHDEIGCVRFSRFYSFIHLLINLIFNIFTSSRWSFGVLLWELFSLGESPAADVPLNDFLEALRSGIVVYSRPKYADDELFAGVIQRCWKHQPDFRPGFPDIVQLLSTFLHAQ